MSDSGKIYRMDGSSAGGVAQVDTGGSGPHPPGMDERLTKLEAAIEGLRHSQNLTVAATAGIGAILAGMMLAFGIYGLQRVDGVDAKVNALPSQVSDSIRESNRAFSDALSTSLQVMKQSQPQQPTIVVLPPNSSPATVKP